MKLLVCGGAGFIGSNFVRLRVREHGDEVVVLDKLTYAGRRENLEGLDVEFVHAGIEDAGAVAEAIDGVDAVVNFAAETHVDRSIAEPDAFVTTHAVGTWVLLEAARAAGVRYLQVSTDEVYGSIERARSPRVAARARRRPTARRRPAPTCSSSSYFHTFGLETLICRGSNNYGPYQYPEKLIPLMVLNALHGDRLPVYGDGMQVRNWLYVEDFARGIGHVLEHGTPGEAYNVGGPDECPNIEVVQAHHRADGRLDEICSSTSPTAPATTAATRWAPRRSARWAGRRACTSPRASSRPSPGTATTRVVGADPLRRLPRRTTSASTARRSRIDLAASLNARVQMVRFSVLTVGPGHSQSDSDGTGG